MLSSVAVGIGVAVGLGVAVAVGLGVAVAVGRLWPWCSSRSGPWCSSRSGPWCRCRSGRLRHDAYSPYHGAASTVRNAVVWKRAGTIEGASEGRSLVMNSRIPDTVWLPRGA